MHFPKPTSLRASAVLFCLSLVAGATATQALVRDAGRTAKPSATISFVDTRRLPTLDDRGNPVMPLFGAAARVASAD